MTRKDIDLLAEAFSSTKPNNILNEQTGGVYGLFIRDGEYNSAYLLGLYPSVDAARQAMQIFLTSDSPEASGKNPRKDFKVVKLQLGAAPNMDFIPYGWGNMGRYNA